MKQFRIILISIVLVITLTVLIKIFFLQIYTVESDNMYKTILPGSKVIINKLSRLEKGDIVLYKNEVNDQLFLSRFIAQYNDTVIISGQEIFVNNKKLVFKHQTNSYCLRFIKLSELDSLKIKYSFKELNNSGFYQTELTQYEYDEIMNDSSSDLRMKIVPIKKNIQEIFSPEQEIKKDVISKDSVFVINDNRSDLYDSRTSGQISKKSITGKVIFIF